MCAWAHFARRTASLKADNAALADLTYVKAVRRPFP
jgi:hypothetical protein